MTKALADRIDAMPRGWLPIDGHVVNITFSLDEADMISAALRLAAQSAAPVGEPVTELIDFVSSQRQFLIDPELRDEICNRMIALAAPPPSPPEMREALEDAEDALAGCYDVTEWPANGKTDADKALAKVRSVLAALPANPGKTEP